MWKREGYVWFNLRDVRAMQVALNVLRKSRFSPFYSLLYIFIYSYVCEFTPTEFIVSVSRSSCQPIYTCFHNKIFPLQVVDVIYQHTTIQTQINLFQLSLSPILFLYIILQFFILSYFSLYQLAHFIRIKLGN